MMDIENQKTHKGWKLTKLGEFCSVQGGFAFKSKDYSEIGVPITRIQNIQKGRISLKNAVKYPKEIDAKIKKFELKDGDVLIAMSGATTGKIGIVEEADLPALLNQRVGRFLFDEAKVNSGLIKFIIHLVQDQVEREAYGAAQPNISPKKIEDFEILLPPLTVQKIMVTKLTESQTTLNEALEALKKAEERLDNVMSSAQHKLIPDDESELPDGWEMVELQEVAEINPKKGEVKEISDDTEVSFVPMAAVSEDTGTIETPEIREIGKVRKGYTYFADGDVLFAKITPCMENGKSAIAKDLKNGIGFGTTEFHVVRPSERLKKEFIYSMLRSQTFRNIAQQNMTGTAGQARLPTDFLKEYQIALPPVEEQDLVIERLAEIKKQVNAARNLYQQALKSAENIQQALLQKAFSGELVMED